MTTLRVSHPEATQSHRQRSEAPALEGNVRARESAEGSNELRFRGGTQSDTLLERQRSKEVINFAGREAAPEDMKPGVRVRQLRQVLETSIQLFRHSFYFGLNKSIRTNRSAQYFDPFAPGCHRDP
jgi:hypothetical protein